MLFRMPRRKEPETLGCVPALRKPVLSKGRCCPPVEALSDAANQPSRLDFKELTEAEHSQLRGPPSTPPRAHCSSLTTRLSQRTAAEENGVRTLL